MAQSLERAIDLASAEQRIDPGYWDIFHRYNETSRNIRARILKATGWDTSSAEAIECELQRRRDRKPVTIVTNSFENLPLGYHQVEIDGQGTNVIVCPDRAYVPDDLRAAGFNVTLYGLRSNRNWGCGDFTDLVELSKWAREIGFRFIGLNPLHAIHNRTPYNTSPYLPLSIFYKNLIYIDIEAAPEFAQSRLAQQIANAPRFQAELKRLRASEIVCYQDVDRIKRRFLKMLFRQLRGDRLARFEDFCEKEGELLENFALYCALDEVLHKQDRNRWTWRQWPAPYQDPESEETRRFARDHRKLIRFYKYIQFVIDEQLRAANQTVKDAGLDTGLYHDLALATDNCGADLWAYRDYFVSGCRVGAPPDDFSPNGQDWAFPPPNGEKHFETGYKLYAASIRKTMQYGGALRIDHVMRLFRLFWIPEGATAAQGTYVRERAQDLLRILALESVQHKNIVVGEDLGTVTDEIREALTRFGILSYRLLYFERHRDGSFKRISEYARQSLVAATTHDLATIAGFWWHRDIEARRAAGLADEHSAEQQHQDRHRDKQRILNLLHSEGLLPHWYPRTEKHVQELDGELHHAIVAFLARCPSMLLLLNQEDLTKETEQQNLPGATSEYPNWQRKMRASIEELGTKWAPFANMFRDQLARSGRLIT